MTKRASVRDTTTVAPRSSAGPLRCSVRDQWNTCELDIARLFEKYDFDKSQKLEISEFKKLLKDFNGGKEASEEEFKWMMKIADKNHENSISKEELHYAMMAWQGYTHMQSEYAQLFDKYDTDKSNDLNVQELQNLLQELNEGNPVSEEQALQVMAAADVMGDQRIGRYELLGAVGIWYLSVGRMPTPDMLVAISAAKGLVTEQPRLNYVQVCLSLFVGFLCIYRGNTWKDAECDKPLARLLILEGIGQLTLAVLTVAVFIFSKGKQMPPVILAIALTGITSLFQLGVHITGIVFVLTTDADSCDGNLWWFSWWLFILPLIITGSIIVCLCCCSCVAAAAAKDNEQSLQEMNGLPPEANSSPDAVEGAPLIANSA